MSFMTTAKIGTHPISHLLGREQACWFDDGSFTMHPLGFNRVEPGTLHWQITEQDAHAFLLAFDLLVLASYPGPHGAAHMPGGVVPDQEPDWYLQLRQFEATPLQELRRDRTDWAALHKAQPDFLWRLTTSHQETIAGQRFGIGSSGATVCSTNR